MRTSLVVAFLSAACGGASGDGVRAVHGIVTVEPAGVDFGDVALGKEGRRSVTLRNDGLVRATVDLLPTSLASAGFEVTGLPVVLGPGEHVELPVTYHPPALGTHGSNLQLVTDVPGDNPAVDLRGHAVRGLAQLSGDVLDFGDVVVNRLAVQEVSLNNNDGHALTTVRIDAPQGADAAAFTTTTLGAIDLGPEQSMAVRFEFRPTRLGDFRSSATITPCPTCSARTITLLGKGVDRLIDVQPPAIDFGDVRLGHTAAQPFSVHNLSKSPVSLTSLGFASGQFLSIALDGGAAPAVLQPGQTVTGTVKFQPMALGQQTAQALLTASDGAPGLIDVTGLGMGPVAQVRPRSVYVGPTALGTTRGGSVTITNVGLDPHQIAPLSLLGISLDTGDPAWHLDSPKSMAVGDPGAAVTVSFSYSPTVAGWSEATLVLISDDDLHPRIEVPLSALARDLPPCQLSISPASPVDFGVMPLFHPTTQGFELTNQTGADCIVGDPQLVSSTPSFRWPGGVAPAGRTLPPGGRMSVRVEFEPEQAIRYDAAVEFYLSNVAAQRQRVALTGAGEDSCFFLTPGTVDFGGSTQGCGTMTQNAWAVNHCAFPVTITSASTSGAPFSVGAMPQGLPLTVQPQTSATIPVDYDPATVGDDVGTLFVTTDMRPAPFQSGLTAGTQPAAPVADSWLQSTPKVDLLVVIDNSGSMAEEQRALASNLDHLWNRIALANADFHLAVTTSGMTPYTAGWTQCPGGADGGEAGRFFPVDASRPRLLTPETPNVRDVLFANTNVGLCHWDERFLDPVIAALTPPLVSSTKAPGTPWPSDGNAGFLRDDARLALLAVTDTDDDSDVPNPPPVSGYVDQLRAIKHGALDMVSFSGIVPLRPCATAESVGTRFREIATQLNGHLEDICDLNNFGALLDGALGNLLQPLNGFGLSQTPRNPSGVLVQVDGVTVTNWTYDATANRIVFPQASAPQPGSRITATYAPSCR